jgi:hypothetical protein
MIASINWSMVLYAAVALGLIYAGNSYLFKYGQIIANMYGIGALIIFIFFGYRWFANPPVVSKVWPPQINTCPDYLTYLPGILTGADIKKDASGGVCVDTLGMSTTGEGISRISPPLSAANVSKTNSFTFTSADVLATKEAKDLTIICNLCSSMGLTWEGVYDGDSCVAINTMSNVDANPPQTDMGPYYLILTVVAVLVGGTIIHSACTK